MTEPTHLEQGTVLPATWDVLSAAAAHDAGAEYVFVSGSAVAVARGFPDRGVVNPIELIEVVREIKRAVDVGVMVDIDEGHGSLPSLTRLIDDLLSCGADSVMIQDVDEAGQSKHAAHRAVGMEVEPSLGDPQRLCERIAHIKSLAGTQLQVLARTDCLPGQPFTESLERLHLYDDAGADWLLPQWAPSFDALQLSAEAFPGRLITLVIEGETGYRPTMDDCKALNVAAVLITQQYQNAFADLRVSYDLSLSGEWDELRKRRPNFRYLETALGLHREGMSL